MAKSHNVDVHVGARMRQRRSLLGMSQTKVGDAVGLTFQQIQKYERGSNRIGSSRLFEFAKVLDVPVSYFFDEMPSNALSGRRMSGRGRKGFGDAGTPFEQEKDPLIKRETLELAHAVRDRWPPVELIVTSDRGHVSAHDLPDRGRFMAKPYDVATLAQVFQEMARRRALTGICPTRDRLSPGSVPALPAVPQSSEPMTGARAATACAAD
jgi:transcriptional regulator with XRE-family HTH domain